LTTAFSNRIGFRLPRERQRERERGERERESEREKDTDIARTVPLKTWRKMKEGRSLGYIWESEWWKGMDVRVRPS